MQSLTLHDDCFTYEKLPKFISDSKNDFITFENINKLYCMSFNGGQLLDQHLNHFYLNSEISHLQLNITPIDFDVNLLKDALSNLTFIFGIFIWDKGE